MTKLLKMFQSLSLSFSFFLSFFLSLFLSFFLSLSFFLYLFIYLFLSLSLSLSLSLFLFIISEKEEEEDYFALLCLDFLLHSLTKQEEIIFFHSTFAELPWKKVLHKQCEQIRRKFKG